MLKSGVPHFYRYAVESNILQATQMWAFLGMENLRPERSCNLTKVARTPITPKAWLSSFSLNMVKGSGVRESFQSPSVLS